jgi:hypothetical protein
LQLSGRRLWSSSLVVVVIVVVVVESLDMESFSELFSEDEDKSLSGA